MIKFKNSFEERGAAVTSPGSSSGTILARDGDREEPKKSSSTHGEIEVVTGTKRPSEIDSDKAEGPSKRARTEPGPSSVKAKYAPDGQFVHLPPMPMSLYNEFTQPGDDNSLTEPESSEDERVDRRKNIN
jgi:hypothetical protein